MDGARTAVFADTVGFIRKLPHHLVSSFRSTLGEITAADLVLHVIDRSHPRWQEQAEVAEAVMEELGVDRERVIKVFNKSDLVPADAPRDGAIWVSAVTGEGIPALKAEVARRIGFGEALAGGRGERRLSSYARRPCRLTPSSPTEYNPRSCGAVAQLGERLNGIQEVVGSIPIGSTILPFSLI